MCPICQGVLQPGKPRKKSVSLSREQSIFTFVECAKTVTLFLNLQQLQLVSWIPRGGLAERVEILPH